MAYISNPQEYTDKSTGFRKLLALPGAAMGAIANAFTDERTADQKYADSVHAVENQLGLTRANPATPVRGVGLTAGNPAVAPAPPATPVATNAPRLAPSTSTAPAKWTNVKRTTLARKPAVAPIATPASAAVPTPAPAAPAATASAEETFDTGYAESDGVRISAPRRTAADILSTAGPASQPASAPRTYTVGGSGGVWTGVEGEQPPQSIFGGGMSFGDLAQAKGESMLAGRRALIQKSQADIIAGREASSLARDKFGVDLAELPYKLDETQARTGEYQSQTAERRALLSGKKAIQSSTLKTMDLAQRTGEKELDWLDRVKASGLALNDATIKSAAVNNAVAIENAATKANAGKGLSNEMLIKISTPENAAQIQKILGVPPEFRGIKRLPDGSTAFIDTREEKNLDVALAELPVAQEAAGDFWGKERKQARYAEVDKYVDDRVSRTTPPLIARKK